MRFIVTVLLSLALIGSGAAVAEVNGTWSVGVTGQYDMPLFKLNQWFPSGGIDIGGTISRINNPTWTFELDARYAKYGSGELENRSFLWSVDLQEYNSSNASSEMTWFTVTANYIYHFNGGGEKLNTGGGAPYFVIGSGFYHYNNEISGLIYPGQSGTLDTNLIQRPESDVRTALGVNAGVGVEYFASQNFAFDLRAQYHVIWGHVRPLEAWGLQEAFPFHKLNLGVRLKLYFPK